MLGTKLLAGLLGTAVLGSVVLPNETSSNPDMPNGEIPKISASIENVNLAKPESGDENRENGDNVKKSDRVEDEESASNETAETSKRKIRMREKREFSEGEKMRKRPTDNEEDIGRSKPQRKPARKPERKTAKGANDSEYEIKTEKNYEDATEITEETNE